MGRYGRPQISGAVYHVTARGILRRDIYRNDDDREAFLTFLADSCLRHEMLCHAYCLMSNHYHLLVETPHANIGLAMHRINCLHANRFNRVHGFEGHVFERPYRAWLMPSGKRQMAAARYIARNPVRAGLCARAELWAWSSHAATVGILPRPSFLSVARLTAWFGSDEEEARARYRRFVDAGVDEPYQRPTLEQLLPAGVMSDLKKARSAGYSLRQISAIVGVSPATLSRRLAAQGSTEP